MPKWTELVFGVRVITEDSYGILYWMGSRSTHWKEDLPEGEVLDFENFWHLLSYGWPPKQLLCSCLIIFTIGCNKQSQIYSTELRLSVHFSLGHSHQLCKNDWFIKPGHCQWPWMAFKIHNRWRKPNVCITTVSASLLLL